MRNNPVTAVQETGWGGAKMNATTCRGEACLARRKLAGEEGFEPSLTESESAVLPVTPLPNKFINGRTSIATGVPRTD